MATYEGPSTSNPAQTTYTSSDDAPEFKRFEDLAVRLLTVPKDEANEAHKAHQG